MRAAGNRAFFSYIIPSVLAFALSGVYTIVDGFFIGQRLGDAGLAAITVAYPVAALIGAIGTGIGLAGAIRFTICGAQGDEEKQRECFSGTSLLMLLISAVLAAALYLLAEPVQRLLGARGEMLGLAVEYGRVIALGAVFQLLSTGFVPFIRNMGGASFAMAAMILGFVTNIVLDYDFVWVNDWGMAGAALATVIGQGATMAAALLYFVMKRRSVHIGRWRELLSLWKTVLKISISPFGLTFSPTITMLLMNRFLLMYGDEQAVAVYGCIGYVISIVYLLLQGVGDGSQPLISRYYGENDMPAVKQTLRMTYLTAAAVTVACTVALYLTRAQIGVLFGMSAESNAGTAHYLPYFLATLLPLAYVRITTAYFYATENVALSYILVYAEPVCTLALLLLAPLAFDLTGVWLAVPLAQVLTFVLALAARLRGAAVCA